MLKFGKAAFGAAVAAGSAVLLPGAAFATGTIDTTAVLASITDMQTAITAVGGAIIVVAAVAVGYKWVKGMLFG